MADHDTHDHSGITGVDSAGLLGVTDYGASGTNYTTTSATLADIDATNLSVAFTAPASGNVLVRISALVYVNNIANCFLGVRESTTNVGAKKAVWQDTVAGYVSVAWKITGISAGAHTYKAAFAVNGGNTFTVAQEGAAAGNGTMTIEVWAAP